MANRANPKPRPIEARSVATAVAKEISRANRPDDPVVAHLQRQLANAFLLYSNYKRCHWQCYGPLFAELHRMFDELADEALGTIDPLAERVRMIGQDPVAGPAETLANASVAPAELGSMFEMIEAADAQAIRVIRELREAARTAAERNDPGSADLFGRIVQIYEKHEWWLRDLLERRNDGLVR